MKNAMSQVRLSRKIIVFALVAILLSWPLPVPTAAAAGGLDSTFGSAGKLTTNIELSEEAFGVALQTDGKIVAVGVASNLGPSSFAVVRYNTDSTLDGSFGTDGKVTTDFDLGSFASDLAIQPDGKIIVSGAAFSNSSDSIDFALVRYNTDGSLDMSFGSDGKVLTDFQGFFEVATVLAIQADGRIVAGGNVNGEPSQTDFVLARYNADGTLDSSFGSGGKVTTDFFGSTDVILDLALQPDGKIVVAGNSFSMVTGGDFALLRYNTNGSLDPTFGSGGRVTTDILGADQARALAIYPNGKIVVGGTALQPTFFRNEDFALARYNTDGSLDTVFGSGGKVTTDFSGSDNVDSLNDLAIQPDGKIVAAGGSMITNRDFALARYETTMPRIQSVSIKGKKLSVLGEDFDSGAVILINGEEQKTKNNAESPNTLLVSKKGGKKIKAGETVILQTRNSDGTLSPEFRFTRPAG